MIELILVGYIIGGITTNRLLVEQCKTGRRSQRGGVLGPTLVNIFINGLDQICSPHKSRNVNIENNLEDNEIQRVV